MAPVLEARGLTKRYGDTVALDGLDLTVNAGETVCLLGANGAGKTTTLHLLLGFITPNGGDALVEGRSVQDDPAAARAHLGYIDEVVSLYPALTGSENIAFFSNLVGKTVNASNRDAVLKHLHFPSEALGQPARTYSKGMLQKVGLAIALLKGAKAILLDEPLSGLDPAAANELVSVLKETAANGTALLISTHDIFRAKQTANWIGILRRGQLVDMIDPATLSGAELEQIYLDYMMEQAA